MKKKKELTPDIVLTVQALDLTQYSFISPLAIGLLALRVRKNQLVVNNYGGPAGTFLSRMKYFAYLGIKDPHKVPRKGNIKTIEIGNASPIPSYIDPTLHKLARLIPNKQNRKSIELLVIELVNNVDQHAQGDGIILGQVINNTIELAIVDSGIGIHKSLCQNPQYANITEQEAIELSVKKGVTAGTGRGYGLWSADTVLRKNRGNLCLGSGQYRYRLRSKKAIKAPNWVGTYVEIKYNLSNPVDYFVETGLGESYKETEGSEDKNDFPF